MLNGIFVALVLVAIVVGAATGQMGAVSSAIVTKANAAVHLAIGLVGAMAFFLGLMKVVEQAGMLTRFARLIAPVMRRLFPTVPPEHPAMSAMIMNIAANALGLTNAATPFGIKAIEQLDTLNGERGTATNAMALFLAINTSAVAILPTGAIAVRASLGSQDAAGILFTTWFASGCATLVGISAALLLARLPHYRSSEPSVVAAVDAENSEIAKVELPVVRPWAATAAAAVTLAVVAFLVREVVLLISSGTPPLGIAKVVMGDWGLGLVVLFLVLIGVVFGVRVYDALVEGAKEGFNVALRIIPFLVAILVSVGMFRASGALELLGRLLAPLTELIGMPFEALPVALIRPLSGSGALGVMSEVMTEHGPDSLIGYMVSTMTGSSDTTFYILAVYYGAISVRRTRHTLPACLSADLAGMLAAVFIVNILYG